MEIWFLYLIRCKDHSLYTGISTDVRRRLKEHQGNDKKGSRYLRGKAPLKTVFKKKIGDKSLASKVEIKVKKLPKAKKELLVKGKLRIKEIIDQVD
ncbi:MAG: GIY-YIG nuclease family protein [Nitrospiraceae bacterium]|jgi:putative endonuclease|nr:MAG: GIY-YIG nuclease family protein [Nitrospiraceae bacterium]